MERNAIWEWRPNRHGRSPDYAGRRPARSGLPSFALAPSLHLELRVADDVAPLPRFRREEVGEFVRRARHRLEQLWRQETLAERRLGDDPLHVAIDPGDDLARRAGGGEQAEPGHGAEARQRFGNGWHL